MATWHAPESSAPEAGGHQENPALKARKLGWIRDGGLHLMGRATYDEMAGFWPYSDDEYAGR
jgi:dihydrofolate reductase